MDSTVKGPLTGSPQSVDSTLIMRGQLIEVLARLAREDVMREREIVRMSKFLSRIL